MKEDRQPLTDSEYDALTIKMLDHYNDGELAYEEGKNKTIKQRNAKRYIKDNLIELGKEANKNLFLHALYDSIMNFAQPTKLRNENILLKKKLAIYETRDANYEALAITLHKDEIYKRVKEEQDKQLLQNLEDSRWVNRKLMDTIEKLERNAQARADYVSKEKYSEVVEKNAELTLEIAKNKKQHKMTAKQKKMAELKRQMALLESSDEEEEIETITEEL